MLGIGARTGDRELGSRVGGWGAGGGHVVCPADMGMGARERLQCTRGSLGLRWAFMRICMSVYPKREDLILTGLISETTETV